MKYINTFERFLYESYEQYDQEYPLAGETVDGREVMDYIPNTSSISASLYRYKILDGVREVSMSLFNFPDSLFKDQKTIQRCKDLGEEIKESNMIAPLIMVANNINNDGPYILEGAHRFDALYYIGAKSFPALVVLDLDRTILESKYYRENPKSTFTHDGSEYDLNKLLKLTSTSKGSNFPVKELKWILKHTDVQKERVEKADLKYPILIGKLKSKWVVYDGVHRLTKAVEEDRNNIKSIKVSDYILNKCKIDD